MCFFAFSFLFNTLASVIVNYCRIEGISKKAIVEVRYSGLN